MGASGVLTGQKAYATNGGIANVVTASVDPELGSRGQAAFIVPPGTKGLIAAKKLKKLGLRASHTADVFLDEVHGYPVAACSAARRPSTPRRARSRTPRRARSRTPRRAVPQPRSADETVVLPRIE